MANSPKKENFMAKESTKSFVLRIDAEMMEAIEITNFIIDKIKQ